VSGDGVVVSLKDSWEDGTCGGLNIVDPLDVGNFEVRDAELRERYQLLFFLEREELHTRLNLPSLYNCWMAESVSSIGVAGSGACK
jgi:hypothetical protein